MKKTKQNKQKTKQNKTKQKKFVIPIPKQYPPNINKWRPVSLTDCFAKISEGFVVDWILEHKIDINQYGNVKVVSKSHYLVV